VYHDVCHDVCLVLWDYVVHEHHCYFTHYMEQEPLLCHKGVCELYLMQSQCPAMLPWWSLNVMGMCCCLQAVRKMMEAKKLESTLNYDSSFGDGNQKG
jgi:hypothetical protein